jgi:hypothetical protein
MMLAVDLFCGLGGWTEGLLLEGYRVIGVDNTRHHYGEAQYPATLILQDVLTLHGAQFKNAALIVASPPCQAYSYRAMPWKKAKALPPPDNALFEACFRIQREACAAAGHHIPLVVENVCGAQKWVGRARWHYGSFYLWGDVPALMPHQKRAFSKNNGGGGWFAIGNAKKKSCPDGRKFQRNLTPEGNSKVLEPHKWTRDPVASAASGSIQRQAASAHIAKIPLELARHIARAWKPELR